MHIEKLKVLVTLRAGEKQWDKGSIIEAPIPHELMSEARAKAKTIEILEPATVGIEGKVKEEDNETSTPPEESSSSDANPVHVFISPDENEVEMENIWQYCKETGMSYGGLNNLVKGRAKTHKGWTYKGLE